MQETFYQVRGLISAWSFYYFCLVAF
jgi:hypothetical protein